MFGLIRTLIASIIVLFAVAQVVPGISYQGDLRVLLQAALVFAVIQSLVVPILNLIALPLNLLSFGLVSVVINVGLFYAISYIVSGFTFSSFYFPGYLSGAVIVPAFTVPIYGTIVIGAIVTSIFLGLVQQIIHE